MKIVNLNKKSTFLCKKSTFLIKRSYRLSGGRIGWGLAKISGYRIGSKNRIVLITTDKPNDRSLQDLAVMVHEQGDMVDSIADNVERASVHVEAGGTQIAQALNYQVGDFGKPRFFQTYF